MIHHGFSEKTFPLLVQQKARSGFGNTPQTGEAEGLLTSLGNVTHFSSRRGALGWLSRCCTDEPHAHTHAHAHLSCCTLCLPLFSIQKEKRWHRNFQVYEVRTRVKRCCHHAVRSQTVFMSHLVHRCPPPPPNRLREHIK